MLAGQPPISMRYVHANAHLLLELNEKQAQKYLMMSDNDFGRMIEDLVIVANSRLKIENVNKKQYTVSEVMDQGYYAYVDEDSKENESKPDLSDPKGEGLGQLGDMFKNFDKIAKEQSNPSKNKAPSQDGSAAGGVQQDPFANLFS